MAKLYHPFWVSVTIGLSVTFGLLFFLLAYDKYGLSRSILLTLTGIAVIWITYVVRAYVFSSWSSGNDHREP